MREFQRGVFAEIHQSEAFSKIGKHEMQFGKCYNTVVSILVFYRMESWRMRHWKQAHQDVVLNNEDTHPFIVIVFWGLSEGANYRTSK